jgi:formylmethanofuran dehydrogenase subunit B
LGGLHGGHPTALYDGHLTQVSDLIESTRRDRADVRKFWGNNPGLSHSRGSAAPN